MAIASDQSVQNWANERTRPRAEAIRALLLAVTADRAQFDDIYEALTQQNPTWTDSRTDGPPVMLTVNDMLAMNAVCDGLTVLLGGNSPTDQQLTQAANNIAGNAAAVNRACVRGV